MSDAWDVFVMSLDKAAVERERGPSKPPVNERFGTAKHRDMVADHFLVAKHFREQLAKAEPVHLGADLSTPKRAARLKPVPADRQWEIAVAALGNRRRVPLGKYAA